MRASPGREWLLLVVLVVASMLLGRSQTAARQSGSRDTVTAGVQAMVSPLAAGMRSAVHGVGASLGSIGRGPELLKRIEHLEQQQKVAELYDARVSRLQSQLADLRKQMGYSALPGRTRIPGDIIGFFPRENRATVSVGARHGVEAGMPAVTGDGLIGLVQTVAPTTCQVQLLSSPREQLSIGAMIARDIPAVGLLYGEGPDRLILEIYDMSLNVQVGDLVTTSGYSEKIPRGLPIGRVVQVTEDPEFGNRKAQVFPHVNIGSVREVTILK